MYYISSFAGFFPSDEPKYSCIVVIHAPKNGYYGNIVAAPVFEKIAHKIYTATPKVMEATNQESTFENLDNYYQKYNAMSSNTSATMPNVKGMSGMDAISLLENMGLNVKFSGTGAVINQSVLAGEPIYKGATITLKLS
jgi:cell division protein FtsI (penicillin-binding protein 3)